MLYRGIIAVCSEFHTKHIITLFGFCNVKVVGGDSRPTSLRRADHSSRGVLLSVVCLSVFEESHEVVPGPIRTVGP